MLSKTNTLHKRNWVESADDVVFQPVAAVLSEGFASGKLMSKR